MDIVSGLVDSMVLQRNRKNVSEVRFTGTCQAGGSVLARVTKAGRAVKGFNGAVVGRAAHGKLDGCLNGVPVGGPYLVELTVVDASGKTLERAKVKNVLVGDVWIAAGQSNMQGVGVVKKPLPLIDKVRAFTMEDAWHVARDPIHNLWDCVDQVHLDLNGGNRCEAPTIKHCGVGPAVSFAQEMWRRTKAPQGVLACAHGGTSMDQWSPTLKEQGTKSLYGATLRRLAKNGGKVAGIIWYQGESDAWGDAPKVYTQKMKDLIAAFRRDCGDESLPVALVQIARFITADGEPVGWNAVQELERKLPAEIANVTTVPAIDLDMDDLIHIGGKPQERLGRRLAQAMAVLKRLPKAGKPPIDLDRIALEPDKRTGLANIAVRFRNVTGSLQAPGRPAGFSLAKTGPLPGIRRTTVSGSRVILETTLTFDQLDDVCLHYGIGLDPYCNITDSADRSLPVIGRTRLTRARAMTPFVRLWRRSGMLVPTSDLASMGLPATEMKPLTSAGDFCDLHLEIGKVREDRVIYLAARIRCAEDMKLLACVGYDGPVKMWIDGKAAFTDPNGTNPALTDRGKAPMSGAKGEHDVVVALLTHGGRAWGVFLRFQRLDVTKEQLENAPERIVMPEVVEAE